MRVLMMASYGLEIVECGGALALALEAGDEVHAAVLLCRDESRPQVTEAAGILGIDNVEFLDGETGDIELNGPIKIALVELLRRVRPDVIIMQDPEHAQHDLDPDRRVIAILYAEAMAIASRDWRIEECGGHAPTPVPTIYYMTPESPNCVVEIGQVLEKKLKAVDVLSSQNTFSAQSWRSGTSDDILRQVVPTWTGNDDETLGREGQRVIFTALALGHGLASHSGAVLAEGYRKEGPFILDRLGK